VMTGNEIVNESLVFNKSLPPIWEVSEVQNKLGRKEQ
jgi:hypothetical protein